MQTISANDLKVKGVAALESALQDDLEVAVAVRGEKRFIVMGLAQYEHLRECELDAAWHATQADLASGKSRRLTAAAHQLEMEKRLGAAHEMASTKTTLQQERAPYSAKTRTTKKTT